MRDSFCERVLVARARGSAREGRIEGLGFRATKSASVARQLRDLRASVTDRL